MARIANLPVKIRNGEGIGGGRVVGWLPIVRQECASTILKLLTNTELG